MKSFTWFELWSSWKLNLKRLSSCQPSLPKGSTVHEIGNGKIFRGFTHAPFPSPTLNWLKIASLTFNLLRCFEFHFAQTQKKVQKRSRKLSLEPHDKGRLTSINNSTRHIAWIDVCKKSVKFTLSSSPQYNTAKSLDVSHWWVFISTPTTPQPRYVLYSLQCIPKRGKKPFLIKVFELSLLRQPSIFLSLGWMKNWRRRKNAILGKQKKVLLLARVFVSKYEMKR